MAWWLEWNRSNEVIQPVEKTGVWEVDKFDSIESHAVN
jgi:hypothetical protein